MMEQSAAQSTETRTTHKVEERPQYGLDRMLASTLQSRIAGAGVGVELWNGVATAPQGVTCGTLVIHDRRVLLGLLVDPDLQFGDLYSDARIDIRGDFG